MNIGEHRIGGGAPVYIIAELGVNHDGDVGRALELVDAAAAAGADAIKMQYFKAGMLMSRASRLAAYQREAGERNPAEMLQRLELPLKDMRRVVRRARERGLHSIVTVFSLELIEEALAVEWDGFKAASPDVVNRPLLEAMSRSGLPMIVSTGAATAGEVLQAYLWLGDADDRLAFLQCVSAYPTPMERASIGGMLALESLTGCPVGYSDHTAEVATGALARRLGAAILEKHLTYDRRAAGPDHAASLCPAEFSEYVRQARGAERLAEAERRALIAGGETGVGGAEKRVLEIEEDVREVSRQSVTLARDVPGGHVLSRDDLTIKRPGHGIAPARLNSVMGRAVRAGLAADTTLREEMLIEESRQVDEPRRSVA
ncbi:MAG: N-acetylneuraminate synthase family protein [Phycisphaerales bacterium]